MSNEETSLAKVSEWGSFLTERADQIAEMLFQPEMATRLIKLMLTAMSRNPVLMHCTKESILYAVIEMGQLGLEPGALGECYVVPFWNTKLKKHEAQMMPGYRGLVKLARNSGAVANITAEPVYEEDEFHYQLGIRPDLVHVPLLCDTEEERGKLKFFYAIAWPTDGSQPIFEVMTKEQVDAIRARSKAKDSGPWVTDYNEMGRKTVAKRITKKVSLSPELAAAVEKDNALEAGTDPRLLTFHPMFGGAVEPIIDDKPKKTEQVIDMLDGIEPPELPEREDTSSGGFCEHGVPRGDDCLSCKSLESPRTPEVEEEGIWARVDDREATLPQIEALRTAWSALCEARGIKTPAIREGLLMNFLGVESFEEMTGEKAKFWMDTFRDNRQQTLNWIDFQTEASN